jgi:hypothetical protein
MHLRRPLALLFAAAAVTSLVGCSDGDDGTAAAHQKACRIYVLGAAAQDKQATTLLSHAARDHAWENDPINHALATVTAAAKEAGLVDHLSDDDFDAFSALVDATGTAYARTNPDGGDGISGETASDFSAAAEKVRDTCASD